MGEKKRNVTYKTVIWSKLAKTSAVSVGPMGFPPMALEENKTER